MNREAVYLYNGWMDGALYRGLARILRERSITAYARIHTVRIRSYMYVTYTNLSSCSPAESAVGPNAGPGEDSLTSDECVQREPLHAHRRRGEGCRCCRRHCIGTGTIHGVGQWRLREPAQHRVGAIRLRSGRVEDDTVVGIVELGRRRPLAAARRLPPTAMEGRGLEE